MNKNKNHHPSWHLSIFISLLMLGFAWAIYAIGSSLEGAKDLATNVLQQEKTKRKFPTKSMRRLREVLAQTPIPPEIIHPTFLCYTPEVEKPLYQGEFMEPEMRVETNKGDVFSVTIYMKNTGNIPWFSDRSGCSGLQPVMRLGTALSRDRESVFYNYSKESDTGWQASNRARLVENRVEPGEIGTFYFFGKAPYRTDTYREYFQPVVEGVAWLTRKEETIRIDVAVGNVDSRDNDRLKYINVSAPASSIPNPDSLKEFHVDISDQELHVKLGDQVVRKYKVSTGTFRTPTPLGKFNLLLKQELRIGAKAPHYRMPKFQLITKSGVGFHALPYLANDNGTFWKEALNHIGQRVSHGCIRLLPDDADDFFSLTALGDTVVIQN